jgi:hypothetical protein
MCQSIHRKAENLVARAEPFLDPGHC